MKQIILRFGLFAFLLLVLFQLSKFSWLGQGWNPEVWIGLFGLLFIGFGILIARYLFLDQPKVEILPMEGGEPDARQLEQLGISAREYEVLLAIENGLSNKEIAGQLYISESTVKTHVSNILQKLDARRRTQAVARAKELGII